jgi:hypothetical protein
MQSYNFITTKLVAAQRTATDLLKSYFASYYSPEDPRTLISTPTYSVTSENVVVQLFAYSSAITRFAKTTGPVKPSPKLTGSALNSLVEALSRLFTAAGYNTVSVQLRIVRLHHPYLNSSILAQFLALNASKYGFARLRHYVLSAIPLSTTTTPARAGTESSGYATPVQGKLGSLTQVSLAGILGVKVQVSGLLTTQRMAPRKTVSTVSAGTFHGPGTLIDYSSHTSKSALGSYTVKV